MRSQTELQRAFADYLLAAADLEEALLDSLAPGLSHPEARLAVYRNNVIARLISALADTYPAVERLVGKEFFRYAARAYIADHAPRSPVLLEYGGSFPDFLSEFPAARSVPYLPDVARLERLYVESYHAAEAMPLPGPAVIRLLGDGGDDRVALHPSARLMNSAYPASRIWEVNRLEAPIEKLKIPGGAEHLLIVRPAATVEVRRVSSGCYALLRAVEDGRGLRSALAEGQRAEPGAALELAVTELANADTFCSTEGTL